MKTYIDLDKKVFINIKNLGNNIYYVINIIYNFTHFEKKVQYHLSGQLFNS